MEYYQRSDTTDVSKLTLKSIYFAIFNSHLIYASQIWCQANNAKINSLSIRQDKALRIINFKERGSNTNPLYNENNILKLTDHVVTQNCLFVYDHLNLTAGLEITARHQTMSGHILKCLAEINFTSAIEQTYDWTNYFKHKIIFVKYFPL